MTQAAQCRARSAVDMTEKTVRATLPQFGRVALSWCFFGIPYGIRTRAATLRGWSPRPLDERDLLRTSTISPLHSDSLGTKVRAKRWGEGNRTPNNRTRNCRVANYTTPQGACPTSVIHTHRAMQTGAYRRSAPPTTVDFQDPPSAPISR